jgi:hypothetical protein
VHSDVLVDQGEAETGTVAGRTPAGDPAASESLEDQ